jgi:hypothetical protein
MARKQQGKSDDELSKELEKLDAKVNSFCLINFSQLINGCAGGGAFTTLWLPTFALLGQSWHLIAPVIWLGKLWRGLCRGSVE